MSYVKKPFEYDELPVSGDTTSEELQDFTGYPGATFVVQGPGPSLHVVLLTYNGTLDVIIEGMAEGFLRKTPEGLVGSSISLADDSGFVETPDES